MAHQVDGNSRAWQAAAASVAGVYIVLHLLGRIRPQALWGTDVLLDHGLWATVLFVAMPLVLLLPVPRLVPDSLRQTVQRASQSRWLPWALGPCALLLFWLGRVRAHSLGDSVKWFEIVRNAVERTRPFDEIAWHNASLSIPGLEFINVQQPLDLIVHAAAYAVLRACGVHDVAVAYQLISIAAGGLYVLVLWHLSRYLTESAAATTPVAVFAVLAGLGTTQLFCGYGESYTLVTLLMALYLVFGLASLRRQRPLWHAAAILGLAAATHMALSLAPSLAVLAWRHPRWGTLLRHRAWQTGLGLLTVLVAGVSYKSWYHGLQLPILTADEPGRYALLSWRHALTLTNALLLTGGIFGLLWGLLGLLRKSTPSADRRFLGLAAGGTALLVCVHDITMGGRDWDLMSFPTVPLVAWGVASLHSVCRDPSRVLRLSAAVLALHTIFWVGINANPVRANLRLENLLLADTNQATHYRHWVYGYYLLEQGDHRMPEAAAAFSAALASAPPDELNTPGTRAFSYRKFAADALAQTGREAEALAMIREVYQRQPSFFVGPSDIALHSDWAAVAYRVGSKAAARGDSAAARQLWDEARVVLERLVQHHGSPRAHHDLFVVLQELGRHERAIQHRARGILPGEAPVSVMLELGDDYLSAGDSGLAALAYGSLLQGEHRFTAEQFRLLGIRLHKAGALDQAIGALRQSLALDPDSAPAHQNLGWFLLLNGDSGQAVIHLSKAVNDDATSEGVFTLAFALLVNGQFDAARTAFKLGFDEFGPQGAAQRGALDNIDWLLAQGVHTSQALALRRQFWPDSEP